MDVEVASTRLGTTRFGRALAVVIGVAAVAGAVLGTVEMDARKEAERAQFMASQLSVDLYGRETAHQIVADAQAALEQQARVAEIEASSRADQAAAAQPPAAQPPDPVEAIVARADAQAAARLQSIASSVGRVPGPASGLDATTRAAIGSNEPVLQNLEGRMIHQLNLARRFSGRRSRTVFALSLVALAAVLAGLAAVIGEGRSGVVAIGAAAVALLVALGAGATTVLA